MGIVNCPSLPLIVAKETLLILLVWNSNWLWFFCLCRILLLVWTSATIYLTWLLKHEMERKKWRTGSWGPKQGQNMRKSHIWIHEKYGLIRIFYVLVFFVTHSEQYMLYSIFTQLQYVIRMTVFVWSAHGVVINRKK